MCVCFNVVISSMTLKMRLKMENRSDRKDITRLGLGMNTNILNIKCVSV